MGRWLFRPLYRIQQFHRTLRCCRQVVAFEAGRRALSILRTQRNLFVQSSSEVLSTGTSPAECLPVRIESRAVAA